MGVFVIFLFLLLFSLAGVIIYLIYWPIKAYFLRKEILSTKRSRQINYAYLIIILICICTATYVSLHPGGDFYADEFKKVTFKDLPESAEFISKSAEYPDFHGNYCSSASIKLSRKDFNLLLQEIRNDLKMKKEANIAGSATFDTTMNESGNKKIIHAFTRNTNNKNDDYLFIGFCDDSETIFVNVCRL